ncbi:MAG: chromate efflux transporter [Rhodospirillales bacterium]|nr:chromate efflux transporter [Acetobacter sp.]
MSHPPLPSRLEIFRVALKLGCTSFGGPVAHLGYFHAEYVQRRRWISETTYADLVALCQFLPGPASSQLGFAISLLRGGLLGGLLAWLGFTLPSAVVMTLCGYGVAAAGDLSQAGWLHGLKLAAVAIVAQAVWAMATKLCPDRVRASVALAAAASSLTFSGVALTQVTALLAGGVFGWIFLRTDSSDPLTTKTALETAGLGRKSALVCLALFFVLLGGLPLWRSASGSPALAVLDGFYRSGALVFGGGHVVLPLLRAETVTPGWVVDDRFLAGYGLAQSIPGPLFTFAAYLGTVLTPPRPHGWMGALLCLGSIFLPSGLLVLGVLPFWDTMRRRPAAQAALRGANAVVVGLLLAALYQPVFTSAVNGPLDLVIVLSALGLLVLWGCPPWIVVGVTAAAGMVLRR